ncbi:MAG: diaminopimelate epimerase [Actinomycetota bacterium]|nr:diaminopimelate epimerase [Actinomycetota bacterium]
MRFAKYHGIGNDFVMVADPDDRIRLTPEVVRRLCDRRFGIGGDGVIRVAPGQDGADFVMDYVNSDGSVGEMCGNGIRCLAVFAADEGLTTDDQLKVATGAGLKVVQRMGDRVRVDMGPPIFEPSAIPVRWDGSDALHAYAEVDGTRIDFACVSIGNPHAVLFVDDPRDAPVTTLGPKLEHHPIFPNGGNVEFVRVESPERVTMRVWERGSGETLACGTGACAVAVVSRLLHGTNQNLTVALPGGELEIEWNGDLDAEASVLMTGPVIKVYDGEVEVEGIG